MSMLINLLFDMLRFSESTINPVINYQKSDVSKSCFAAVITANDFTVISVSRYSLAIFRDYYNLFTNPLVVEPEMLPLPFTPISVWSLKVADFHEASHQKSERFPYLPILATCLSHSYPPPYHHSDSNKWPV